MSIEQSIYDALRTLVANRVYPDVAPDNAARPYITYQQVGGQPVNFVDATVPSKKNGRFRVTVWAATRIEASTLMRQIEDALRVDAALQTTVLTSALAMTDTDTRLKGAQQDFSFWFS